MDKLSHFTSRSTDSSNPVENPPGANRQVSDRESGSRPEWRGFSQAVVNGALDLRDRKLSPDVVGELAEWLATSPPELLSLDLIDCEIGTAGALLVAEALKTNSILTTLNLEGNKIGPADATALAGALKTNMTLASLRLEANRIGDDGARALADALKTNKTLAELVLYFNGIGEAGGTSLAEALNNNTTLTALHVYRGSREKWIKEIDVKLERNRLQPQMAGAAVALEVASDRQYPPEIMQLIVQQLIVLPPKLKEDGRDTVRELSKWVAYPPRKP